MSQEDVNPAEIQERTLADKAETTEEKDNYSKLFALSAELTQRFHSSQQMKDQFTVEIALQQTDNPRTLR